MHFMRNLRKKYGLIYWNTRYEKEKKTKKISNQELLESMNKRFSGIDKRFSGIETSNQETLESINRSFSKVETKITNLDLKITTEIQDFRSDFKSFKKDTNESIKKTEEDIADLADTDMLHDKRIEKLENKFI